MSIDNFKPTIWSGALLRKLWAVQVFAQPKVCNRDYEGEIRQRGDTVRITSIGTVTVSDYTRDTDLSSPQALSDASQSLVIDQQKSFNFAVDDLDAAQAAGNLMTSGASEAGSALRNGSDRFIASLYSSAANLLGSDGSPKTISAASDVYPYLVDLKVMLDEANVPEEGRWCILPPWLEGYLLKDDRFVKAGNLPSDQRLMNGQAFAASGFAILMSNNVTHNGSGTNPVSGDKSRVMAGHPMAITFAEQIVKTEAYRPEKRFADALKGLYVYGGRVVRPEALAVLTIQRP